MQNPGRNEPRLNMTYIVHMLVINHIFVSNWLEALDHKRSSKSRVPAEIENNQKQTLLQTSLDLDKLHLYVEITKSWTNTTTCDVKPVVTHYNSDSS